jgi:hypothetical protein
MEDGLNGLDDIIEGRVEELYRVLSANKSYRKLLKEHSDMFEKLIGLLPEEEREMLFELDSKYSELSEEDIGFYYINGIMDCIAALLGRRVHLD